MALEPTETVTNTDRQAPANTPLVFMLGAVEVRAESLVLVVDGEDRRVEPRVMDLLVYGSERAGQLLSREQIMQDVWGGTHLVPEALQRVVSLLRKSLGDNRDDPVFIETISSKGYRFLLSPELLKEAGAEDIKLTEKSVRSSPLALIIGALALVLITWFLIDRIGQEDAWAPQAEPANEENAESSAPVPENDG